MLASRPTKLCLKTKWDVLLKYQYLLKMFDIIKIYKTLFTEMLCAWMNLHFPPKPITTCPALVLLLGILLSNAFFFFPSEWKAIINWSLGMGFVSQTLLYHSTKNTIVMSMFLCLWQCLRELCSFWMIEYKMRSWVLCHISWVSGLKIL